MRFGGLVAVNSLDFNVGRGDITALIGPNGAGKTTVFNCITGFYKPTEGRISLRHGSMAAWDGLDALTIRSGRSAGVGADRLYLLERMPDFLVSQRARVARTFQNIRLFQGMTVLENLLVAQHNPLDQGVRLLALRHSRPAHLRQGGGAGGREGEVLARPDRPHAAGRRSGRRPALWRRNGGSRSRGRCARTLCCSASTNLRPDSTRARAPSSTRFCGPSAGITRPPFS